MIIKTYMEIKGLGLVKTISRKSVLYLHRIEIAAYMASQRVDFLKEKEIKLEKLLR